MAARQASLSKCLTLLGRLSVQWMKVLRLRIEKAMVAYVSSVRDLILPRSGDVQALPQFNSEDPKKNSAHTIE